METCSTDWVRILYKYINQIADLGSQTKVVPSYFSSTGTYGHFFLARTLCCQCKNAKYETHQYQLPSIKIALISVVKKMSIRIYNSESKENVSPIETSISFQPTAKDKDCSVVGMDELMTSSSGPELLLLWSHHLAMIITRNLWWFTPKH